MLTQIINGHILTPQGWMKDGSVLISDGKILEVTNSDLAVIGAKVVDAKGMSIVPGFVAMNIHGGGGFDFSECTEEAFHGAVADPGLSAKFPAADSQRLALGVDWVLGLRHLLSLLLYKFTAFAVILQDAILPYKRSILWTSCALRLRRLCGITQTSKTKGVRPTRRFVP